MDSLEKELTEEEKHIEVAKREYAHQYRAKTKRIEDVPGYYATLSKGKAIRRLFKSIQKGKKSLVKK